MNFDNSSVMTYGKYALIFFYLICYLVFLQIFNDYNDNDDNDDNKNKFFIYSYLTMSLILSCYLIYKYFKIFNYSNSIYKIIYSILIITCILNLVGIFIFIIKEIDNDYKRKYNLNNNLSKFCLASAVLFNVLNTLFLLIEYYLDKKYIEGRLENDTIICFNKYYSKFQKYIKKIKPPTNE